MPKLSKDEEALCDAAQRGDASAVSRLLAAGATPNVVVSGGGSTPLHFAAFFGHTYCAQQLVAAGASLEARTQLGLTPLHTAANRGHAYCAQQLVAVGASLEARTKSGFTPADCAAAHGYEDLAQKLRAVPASLGAIDQGETTVPRRHLMFSGRFDGSAAEKLIRDTYEQMKRRHPSIPTYIVEASAGTAFDAQTMRGCSGMAAMAAFCGSNYGEKTASGYSTYNELNFAYEHNVPIIPIRLCQEWPPTGGAEAGPGYDQNNFVFKPSLVYLDFYGKQDPEAIADELAKAWVKLFP